MAKGKNVLNLAPAQFHMKALMDVSDLDGVASLFVYLNRAPKHCNILLGDIISLPGVYCKSNIMSVNNCVILLFFKFCFRIVYMIPLMVFKTSF